MINTLLLLLVYELVGEMLVRAAGLSLPGPVLGMFALLGTLMLRGRSWPALDAATTTLLSHLSLLFIPAGVGVIVHAQRLSAEWLPLLVSLLVSTVMTLGVTAWVLQRLLHHGQRVPGRSLSKLSQESPESHPSCTALPSPLHPFRSAPVPPPVPGEGQP